jgi:eukaryotic-like serine/threonine-protein kinase
LSGGAREQFAEGAILDGRYAVDRKIGAGAFAEVWRGRRIATGERVALKRPHPPLLRDEEVVERLRREAYFLQRVRSDHVVKIHELLVDPVFSLVLVMEYVDGHLLSTLMESTMLSVEEGIDLGIDLLRGLRDLHEVRIIHRDLKPSNVMLRPLGDGDGYRAIIFDFSLSRLTRRPPAAPATPERSMTPPMQALTRMNVTLGTLQYMAPEQILDSRAADERSDLYSLGSILYTAIVGEHPFAEFEDPRELARAKLEGDAPPLAIGRSDALTIELEAVVAKALARRPADRYGSAKEMLDELLRLRALPGEWPDAHDVPRSADLVKRGSTGSVRAARRISSKDVNAVRSPAPPSSKSVSDRAPLRPSPVIMIGAAPSEPSPSSSRHEVASASIPSSTPPPPSPSSAPPSSPSSWSAPPVSATTPAAAAQQRVTEGASPPPRSSSLARVITVIALGAIFAGVLLALAASR